MDANTWVALGAAIVSIGSLIVAILARLDTRRAANAAEKQEARPQQQERRLADIEIDAAGPEIIFVGGSIRPDGTGEVRVKTRGGPAHVFVAVYLTSFTSVEMSWTSGPFENAWWGFDPEEFDCEPVSVSRGQTVVLKLRELSDDDLDQGNDGGILAHFFCQAFESCPAKHVWEREVDALIPFVSREYGGA